MKGRLIVISGPSGVGKGTVAEALARCDPNIKISVSATTRAPRQGDVEGEDYYFISHIQFRDMIEKDEFLEYAEYVGNYYGTPKKYVLDMLARGINIILEIDVQGAFQIKEKYPNAVLIFLTAPIEELARRIQGRQKMNEAEMERRLDNARWEFSKADRFDYVVENKDLDVTVGTIQDILKKIDNMESANQERN